MSGTRPGSARWRAADSSGTASEGSIVPGKNQEAVVAPESSPARQYQLVDPCTFSKRKVGCGNS